ncbi:outer membrane protein assembly factor BamA [uncultured Tateyamaria sp.]|uniref:outer membrane protein assembly factor BamA n=1 Tax=uncultured Tateyamaria sp. TaxID=455651 RepID=UPI002627FBFC|nr:outer membrane protein assembly factor BamA [uncultured Tateyamaria sp.]
MGQSATAFAQQFRFTTISVEGNARVGDAAIITRAGIAPGQTVTAGQVNDALQNLQSSGLFESVEVEPQGSRLLITVVELPTLNRVTFEGNRRLDDEALSAIVQSQERRVFSPAQADRDASSIAEAYSTQGRIAARVTPRIIRRADNRVDLIFEIFEGDVVEIERLSFVGNRVFSDRRLRRVLQTKQAGLFRALIRSDTLIEDRIEFDKQVLRDFYFSRGYVDFRTLSSNAELTEERDGFFLVFNVQEGQQFRFGEVTVSSDLPEVDADAYEELIKVRPGVVYSPTLVEAEVARLEVQGQREGVDFLRVEPRVIRNDRDLTLDVELILSRGPRVFVERIDIEGNTTTLDNVLRRQFKIAEGDPFNPREIRDAAERIRVLDFFASSNVNAREGSRPDQVVIDVDVEEKPTGSLNFGGSYSVNDGFGLAVSFTERNFLGRGQTLGLTFSTAEDAERYGIRFVEPSLLGRDVAFGLNLQYSESDSSFANYDSEALVFSPSLTFPVSENGRLELRYTARSNEVLARDPIEHGTVVQNEIDAGEQFSSALGYTYSYDSRNSGLNPNAGVLLEFSQDFAGLGGDSEYIRTTAKVVGQRRVFSEEVTLRASLEGGLLAWSGGTNRTIDRFAVGPSILRGFEPGGIGPRDNSGSGDSDPLGGNIYVAARFEAEFPVGLPEEYGIRGAVFYDVGNLWDLSDVNLAGGSVVGEGGSFRHVIGVSILWDTVVGPLRFNFTNALRKEDFDQEQTFDLTLSTTF